MYKIKKIHMSHRNSCHLLTHILPRTLNAVLRFLLLCLRFSVPQLIFLLLPSLSVIKSSSFDGMTKPELRYFQKDSSSMSKSYHLNYYTLVNNIVFYSTRKYRTMQEHLEEVQNFLILFASRKNK